MEVPRRYRRKTFPGSSRVGGGGMLAPNLWYKVFVQAKSQSLVDMNHFCCCTAFNVFPCVFPASCKPYWWRSVTTSPSAQKVDMSQKGSEDVSHDRVLGLGSENLLWAGAGAGKPLVHEEELSFHNGNIIYINLLVTSVYIVSVYFICLLFKKWVLFTSEQVGLVNLE